MAMTDE